MSVERRFLNFDDLKVQVRVTGATLNKRTWQSRHKSTMPTIAEKKPQKQALIRKSTSAYVARREQSDLRAKQSENMAEDLESLRYVRISPPPLDKVPRPKNILFEGRGTNGVYKKTAQIASLRRSLTRGDFMAPTKTPFVENVKHLNSYKLDVNVEVKPKYYQKWARNSKKKVYSGDMFNFQSTAKVQSSQKFKMKIKELRKNRTKSGQRKRELSRVHSSGSLCSNENACSNGLDWRAIPTIAISGFTDDEHESGVEERAFDNADTGTDSGELTAVEPNVVDSHMNEITSDPDGVKISTDKNATFDEVIDPKKEVDAVACSNSQSFLTVEIDENHTKGYPFMRTNDASGYTVVRVAQEESSSSENSPVKTTRQKRTPAQEVTLSKQLISAHLLDGIASRLPVVEDRLESPFRYERDYRFNQDKPTHYSYYPSRPIYNDMKKKQDNFSQMTMGKSASLDYRRCKTDTGICMTSLPESRIPMKMATASPRFSIPDNLIVDFETLRIAAHMDKLRKTLSQLPSGPRDFFVNKSVSDSPKSTPSVSSVKSKGFRTVVFGSSVP